MKKLAILGSTGSIGTQTLDVVSRHPDRFGVEVLTAYNNVELLAEQARKYNPDSVAIVNPDHYLKLKDLLSDIPVKVYAGIEAVEQLVAMSSIDMLIAAMVGFSGLRPVISAIEAGKNIALANKETLVVAGEIISKLAIDKKVKIIPIDSEHSAILQCLVGEMDNPLEKITLTASGGPFRKYSVEQIKKVTPAAALDHPNWSMGKKITIDSASMMNKGLEVIEAKWFFDLHPSKIEVIIHPESIVHSFVHFADGSIKAQLGLPDMRLPIIYALEYPGRIKTDLPRFDLQKHKSLNFEAVDIKKFRNLALAYSAIEKGGNMPCIMNAANEIAVEAFLQQKMGFWQMTDLIESVMNDIQFQSQPGLDDLENTDRISRETAMALVNKLRKK